MRRPLLPWLFAVPGCLFATYSYYYTDPLTSINTANWYQNGSVAIASGGLTGSSANGGSLISKLAVPDGTSDYEVMSTLTLPASGGTYVQLVRATTNAMSGPGATGTYYSVEVQNPTWSGAYCSATLAIYKRVSNVVTLLSSSSISCYNGLVMRTVVRGSTLFVMHSSPYSGEVQGWPAAVTVTDSSITSGVAGIGVYNTPSGNSVENVSLGPLDRVAPSAVTAQSIATYVLPNRVEMQWQGVVDDANGIGLWNYQVYRNQVYIGQTFTPDFDDDAVTPGTQYSYMIKAVDAHQNVSATTVFGAVTPAAGAVDARRIGVRPLGSYWGDAGEQIDTLSGNLNFTYPLMTAMGRGAWSATFALNYNSQLWRKDSGGVRKLGRDVGYGFGWRLIAGSLTPIWQNSFQLDHFIYTDSTGAEYRLDQYDAPNCMWTSLEGVHVGYNSCMNRLYFPDGSFWSMAAASAGIEQDAGTMYPTLMEDTNGNQVTIAYQNGLSSPLANSSARISSVEDVRAIYTGQGPSGYQTYSFTYDTETMPHLTNVTSHIAGVGNWTLTYLTSQALNEPFNGSSFGTTSLLGTAGMDSDGLPAYQFQYASSGSGELTQVTTMNSGVLGWAYRNFTYTGNRTFREVQNRFLTIQSGGTQYTYPFTRNDAADASLSFHSGVTLDDPSGIGEKAWTFATSGASWQLGLTTRFEDRPSAAQASQPLQRKDFTWVQDSAGTPYIGTVLTTLEPAGANLQTKTTQTLDSHGNVTQTAIYDYGNLTTAARTYNYVYGYAFAGFGFTSYRLTSATVTNGTQSVTLVTNHYDTTALTNVTSVREHDANYGTGATVRGNLTTTAPAGGPTTTITRDITGNVVSTNDGVGHLVSVTTSTATNYAAPDVITPNSNTNLNQSMTYTQSLALSSLTGPNSSVASATYDTWSRPATSTSVYGAVTSYIYSTYQQATTNNHWLLIFFDGFGRPMWTNRGYNDGAGSHTISTVITNYTPCSCSPLGKVQSVSQPYAPAGTVYYTTYTYDGLGRTVQVVAPDGASTTNYAYSGNTTTVTDPAGKWKKQTVDVFGNLKQVNEPNPAGGADYVTTYTYDLLNHLTQVSMPRPTGTQTRTFVYDPATQRLTSETHPESGTKTYTYNADGTMATRTDANSMLTQYTYDSYRRVTMVQYFPNRPPPIYEDPCQRLTLTYDTNSIDSTYSQNSWGRLTTAQWGGVSSCTSLKNTLFTQMYSYTAGGLVTGKRLEITRNSAPVGYPINLYSVSMDVANGYDGEAHVTSTTYPTTYTIDAYGNPVAHAGPTVSYTFDTMARPSTMVTNQPAPNTTIIQSAQYNAADQTTQLNYNSPYYETRQYNALLQLTQITNNSSTTYAYTYSSTQNNGRITQFVDNFSHQTVSYTYDTLNRLATSSSNAGWAESFTYDGFGNLTDKTPTAGSPPALHVTVNATTNRINGDSYDTNGNLISSAQGGGQYDGENRLVASVGDNYAYGVGNLRVWKSKPDGTEELHIYGASGERLGTYPIWPLTQPNGQPNGKFYVAAGTAVAYFAGRVVGTRDRMESNGTYYPYGEDYGTPVQNSENFATYYRDGTTGLDYAKNRYYSSILGRFMTPDPYRASGGAGDPGSWNRYAYASDDPVNANDPSGMITCYPGTGEASTPWCTFDPGEVGVLFSHGMWPFRKVTGEGPTFDLGAAWHRELNKRLRQETTDALRNLSRPCKDAITGDHIDLGFVASNAQRTNYFNAASPFEGSLFVRDIAGYPTNENLTQYLGDNVAAVLLGIAGTVTNSVVVGSAFFSTIQYGSSLAQSQDITLVHEALHTGTGQGDADLANTLQLGFFSNSAGGNEEGSRAISNWLANDCPSAGGGH